MKNLLLITLLFISTLTFAQDWQINFEKAKEMALKNKQPIILVFQGSDWCTPCMKLEQEIWSSKEFKAYAKENYTLVKADFPRRRKNKLSKEQTKQNDALAEKYNTNGVFPLVVVLDSKGKVLGKTSYKKTTPKAYLDILNGFIK